MSDSDYRARPSLLGRTIGNHQIEAVLGTGGMGQVYRARHLLLDRVDALKLMHAHMLLDPSLQARFRREARTAALLSHPHIVQVYHFDEIDGHAYLVMELITGGTFRELLSQRTAKDPNWSLAYGLDLVRQAADALAYAHANGTVHRDIKPENLLLQPNLAGGLTLKVGDFGLAHIADSGGSFATQSGMAMGTLAYMAPEQASGKKELDGRADIYALGVILYELAVGQLPFEVKTLAQAIYQHNHIPPLPLRSIRPEIPEALEELVLRCLAKLPEQRFASATELAVALRNMNGLVPLDMPTVIPIVVPSPDTQVQPDNAGSAPEAYRLTNDTNLPRILVLDKSGKLLQVVAIRPGGMSVGRITVNDLQLDMLTVSRHHLQVTWDGVRVYVTDLASQSGTELNGVRLPAHVLQEWSWNSMLHVGAYWLQLDAPHMNEHLLTLKQPIPGNTDTDGMSFPLPVFPTGEIGVIVEPETLMLTPGQTEAVQVTLVNMSNVTNLLSLSISGSKVSKEWVQLPPTQQIGPRGQAFVQLKVTVPETSDVAAGDYLVEIRARSRTNPEQSGEVLGYWTVRPFMRARVQITPARLEGRGRGQYRVALYNEGNTSARFRLSFRDDDGLDYHFEPEQLTVAAGASEQAALMVEGEAPLLGSSRIGRFEVLAKSSEGGATATGSAQFVRMARLPWLVVPMIALLLLVALGVAAAVLNPQRSLTVGGGIDLRTIVVQTAAVVASQHAEQETLVAGVLNQTSTAIALLPLAQRAEAETAQALVVQQTEVVLNQQRSTAEAQQLSPTQAALQTTASTPESQLGQQTPVVITVIVVAAPTNVVVLPTVPPSTPRIISALTSTPVLTGILVPSAIPAPGVVIAGAATATNTSISTATSQPTVMILPTLTMALQLSPTPTPTPLPTATPTPTPLPTATPTAVLVPNEEYVDTTRQEANMHACPPDYAIAGVSVVENKLLCRRMILVGDVVHIQTLLDTATQRASMHACPTGMYMRGLRADLNQLLCSYDDRVALSAFAESEDSSTQGYGMHICPNPVSSGRRMLTGIQADQNRFLCGLQTS